MQRQTFHLRLLLIGALALPASLPIPRAETHASSARIVEQVLVVIDGEPYTLSNVETFAKTKLGKTFPTGDLNSVNAADREVLEYFITEKLLEAAVREAGIRITDSDIDQYIDEVKQTNRLSDQEFAAALSREGQTLAGFRAWVKSRLEENELVGRHVRRISITDEDVERYYKLNANRYRTGERARLSHILLPLAEDAPPERVKSVTAQAEELYRRIAAGEDFAALARAHSDGAGREAGGDIGWVSRGTLLKPIEDLAFEKLAVGQVSRPLRTSLGVHLVKLAAREGGQVPPLSAVAPKIKEELYMKAVEERRLKWLKTDLRRKHRVDVKLAGVVFKPEDMQEGTVDTLVAKSTRATRKQERSLLSYLNPFSYIYKETPVEEDDPQSPLRGKSIVTVFGVPLFTTESVEDVPDVLPPPDK
ncbi:MAG TPA: peptidylprolyl isomerase [Candidatus Eisenbacteria bacterium]|nr:peptidylprolyl isomerase [Candidatus Eisenbacteria bacterium]